MELSTTVLPLQRVTTMLVMAAVVDLVVLDAEVCDSWEAHQSNRKTASRDQTHPRVLVVLDDGDFEVTAKATRVADSLQASNSW
jgi:hypothetical protein